MPIRFRCVYCDKLLGIATRKAGTVVNCPQCGQPLIVPSPEPEPTHAATAGAPAPVASPSKLFEENDFDVILEPDATLQKEPPPRPKANRPPPPPAPPPQRPFPVERSLPTPPRAPMPLTAPAPASGIVLSPVKLIIALAAVFVCVGIAFAGGILVGRMLN